ncbi:mitochondrial mRNA pseudouridine synthase RPUSD3-like [Diadema antillarum]|uniref:mitochondrial mRNA pseudouridine synthase RPUSD3-like n=1 Tax=Diadema antillarum TaxID=105358 RepID=UPI003A86FE2E
MKRSTLLLCREIEKTTAAALHRSAAVPPRLLLPSMPRECPVSVRSFARLCCYCKQSCRKSSLDYLEVLHTTSSQNVRRYHRHLRQHLSVLEDERSVVDFIKKNIVYKKDGIIALNKPPGLPVAGKKGGEDDPAQVPSISSLMPHIVDLLDSPAAEIAVVEMSGLVLLGEDRITAQEISAKFQEARRKRVFLRTYKSIVCGVPEPKEGVLKMYLGDDVIHGKRMTVVHHDPSQKKINQGLVWSAETNYKVVSENRELGCALLELQPLRVRRHQLQVQLAAKLCPVLGDHTYSHQVQTILGEPMLIDPRQIPAPSSVCQPMLVALRHSYLPHPSGQVLPHPVKRALSLTHSQASCLPLFIHLHHALIPGWRGRGDIAVVAPLPSHFSRALQELQLHNTEPRRIAGR